MINKNNPIASEIKRLWLILRSQQFIESLEKCHQPLTFDIHINEFQWFINQLNEVNNADDSEFTTGSFKQNPFDQLLDDNSWKVFEANHEDGVEWIIGRNIVEAIAFYADHFGLSNMKNLNNINFKIVPMYMWDHYQVLGSQKKQNFMQYMIVFGKLKEKNSQLICSKKIAK